MVICFGYKKMIWIVYLYSIYEKKEDSIVTIIHFSSGFFIFFFFLEKEF